MPNGLFGFFENQQPKQTIADDAKLVVKKARCPQNHPCPSIKVCPTGALVQKGYAAPQVKEAACIKCGKCVNFCPMRALVLE